MNKIKNAIISNVSLTRKEMNLLNCYLYLDYGGSVQGFGGWALYLPSSYENHELKSVAGHHIFRIMEIADVECWDDLNGKSIRVKTDKEDRIVGIGHIVKDDWYFPEKDFNN